MNGRLIECRAAKGPRLGAAAMTQVSATRFSLNPSAAFLTTIYQLLEEQEVPPTRMQTYAQAGVSYQAANARLHILEREKLVTIVDHRVRLTEQGRRRAAIAVRKHRLCERLLVDVVGLEWELAHAEASRWQHVLGERVERRLLELLPDPWTSPFGNAIPAIEELDAHAAHRPDAPSKQRRQVIVRCDHFADHGGGWTSLHSISEGAQTNHELLRRLGEARLIPGTKLRVSKQTPRGRIVLHHRAGMRLTLAQTDASGVLVSVETAPL